MTEITTPFNEHQHILNRTADVELLADSDSNVGSIMIDYVYDGQIIPMSDSIGLEADFINIDALAWATPENYQKFKNKTLLSPEMDRFRDKISELTDEQKDLELKVYFIAGLALEYFGKRTGRGIFTQEEVAQHKTNRDTTYYDYAIDDTRKDTMQIKPLSEAGKSALCTEYSVFMKEALHRLDSDFAYIAVEKKPTHEKESFYHSFLVSQDGKIIVDPIDAVQFHTRGLPFGVFSSRESLLETTEPVIATQNWGTRQTTYSLSHIQDLSAAAQLHI
ncbi:hypothetical protein KC950_04070 [Candidatus Saccharibacteria bacterium]|nr:hypothetical protein [Candidatus Saccharibacteria bacterium]